MLVPLLIAGGLGVAGYALWKRYYPDTSTVRRPSTESAHSVHPASPQLAFDPSKLRVNIPYQNLRRAPTSRAVSTVQDLNRSRFSMLTPEAVPAPQAPSASMPADPSLLDATTAAAQQAALDQAQSLVSSAASSVDISASLGDVISGLTPAGQRRFQARLRRDR